MKQGEWAGKLKPQRETSNGLWMVSIPKYEYGNVKLRNAFDKKNFCYNSEARYLSKNKTETKYNTPSPNPP